MKILVTGGSGVIGNGLIPELLKAGHEVRLLSRKASKASAVFPHGIEAFEADITNPEQLAGVSEGCECVIHITGIAEERPPEVTFKKVNVEGTRNVLKAVETSQPFFIFISSLGADKGTSAYHKSKRDAEEVVRAYPGRWLIIRPANVYGPGDAVVSTILTMVRSLPVVPIIDDGEQPFQPIWYTDLGRALAGAVNRTDLFGKTLELAGGEVTSTNDLLDRLAEITDRSPMRIPVASWMTELAVKAVEGFGGKAEELFERLGLAFPINSSKLRMLMEGSFISGPGQNALTEVFHVRPTHLQDGLEILADSLPEQLPKEGVGRIEQKTLWVDIEETTETPGTLIDLFCNRFSEILPVEMKPPHSSDGSEPGETLTGKLPLRGDFQVRLEERTATSATFLTVEGHPLAGIITASADKTPRAIRFTLRVSSRPANIVDWVGLRTIGWPFQNQNWRAAMRRVVELVHGSSPRGVQSEARFLNESEERELVQWAEQTVQKRKRAETGNNLEQAA